MPALAILLAGCEATPVEQAQELARALERQDRTAIEAQLHPDYSDPLGDRAQLLSDLDRMFAEAPRLQIRLDNLEALRADNAGATIEVVGEQEIRLDGEPSWKLKGALKLELVRSAGHRRVRGGILDDLRGIRALFLARRAALEGNDVQAFSGLLHPLYRDGDRTPEETLARLAADLAGVRVRLQPLSYWVEVRGLLAHVDERFWMTVGTATTTSPAGVGRFTLRRSSGLWRLASGLYPAERAEPH